MGTLRIKLLLPLAGLVASVPCATASHSTLMSRLFVTGVATARTTQRSAALAVPSAVEFKVLFVGAWNQYAEATGDPRRLRDADCVEAAPARYMCSYAVVQPDEPMSCHLMQARWTPGRASTITITLAGRTARCRTLHEALRSLR